MEEAMAESAKVYVTVRAEFNEEGLMFPKELVWEDGHRYEIERVTDVCRAASRKAGGQGDRYTVIIGGRESHLFFERNASVTGNNLGRWFVERK